MFNEKCEVIFRTILFYGMSDSHVRTEFFNKFPDDSKLTADVNKFKLKVIKHCSSSLYMTVSNHFSECVKALLRYCVYGS